MKFVLSNQKFSETILFLYRNFYHFDKIVRKKFFIRLLTAKMSTINLCKMQKAPAGGCGIAAPAGDSLSAIFQSS